MQLAFADGVLTLDAGSGDEAQASEAIEAQIDGDAITTGFNPQFLLDGLTVIDEGVIELGVHAGLQACCHQRGGGESGSEGPSNDFRYLLMPRRLLS